MIRSASLTVLVAAWVGCGPAAGAPPAGTVTILDGDAILIRGLSRLMLAEGVRVAADDLVETGSRSFMRVEFADGAIVDLGAATRVQLNRPSLRKGDRAGLYLLAGWLKLTADKLPKGATGSIASRDFDTLGVVGRAVVRAESTVGSIFAEDGPVRVSDRRRGAAMPLALASGDYLVLRGREAARIEREPARDFVTSLPRPFLDRLPSRIALFRDREVAPRSAGTFTYAEVEAWLDAEPFVRRRFVREWLAKADDAAFRERLDAGLARHPEWERILHPERFEPAQAPPVASTPPAAAAPPPH